VVASIMCSCFVLGFWVWWGVGVVGVVGLHVSCPDVVRRGGCLPSGTSAFSVWWFVVVPCPVWWGVLGAGAWGSHAVGS